MKNIILTERDNKIIEFLREYKCATTSTISSIFFNGSLRPTSRRLKLLKEHNLINSSQEYVSKEKVHYLNKKPTQLKHSLIVTNFIAKLYEHNIEILKSKIEFKIGSIRSDLMMVCKIDNRVKIFLIEVCNTKKFDNKKYVKLKDSNEWKKYFPVFPDIIVISDKKFESDSSLNIIYFNLKLDNFKL